MGHIRPTTVTTRTTDNFAAHKARGSGLPGLDYATPVGEPIVATEDGIVTRANYMAANGKNVRIANVDGLTSYFLHFSRIDVTAGQHVKKGQVIGLSGNTGRTTGPHMHISFADKNGVLIDPAGVIGAAGTTVVSHRTVKLGSSGADVRYLQRRLGVGADGVFGPITRRAVINFQKSHGLAADGIVGPKTWAAIG
jgi:murein DD-endopeptidase MepM/ murein hydrolase activator NlpD